jgi:hypothetical protein
MVEIAVSGDYIVIPMNWMEVKTPLASELIGAGEMQCRIVCYKLSESMKR